MDELVEFIKEENKRLDSIYRFPDRERKILAKTVKLMEEVGELSNEILHHMALQRNEKQSGNLEEEFADVMITAMLLADSMGIDIAKALNERMDEIRERRY